MTMTVQFIIKHLIEIKVLENVLLRWYCLHSAQKVENIWGAANFFSPNVYSEARKWTNGSKSSPCGFIAKCNISV